MRRGALLVFFALATGCSLIVDLGGLGGSDASSDVEASTPDVATDVINDAPPLADGPVDDSGRWCAAYADGGLGVFCEDFDEPDASFTFSASNGATASLDEDAAYSPPRSVVVNVPVVDGGPAQHASYNHPMSPIVQTITYSLDFRVDLVGNSGADVMQMQLPALTGQRYFILSLDPTGMHVIEQYSTTDAGLVLLHHPHITFTWDGAWHRAALTVHLMSPRTSTLVIDGATVEANAPLDPAWAPSSFTPFAGITYTQGVTTPWKVHVDDMLVVGQ